MNCDVGTDQVEKINARLEALINDLRRELDYSGEPQLCAMLETAAEVVGGLKTAFAHYAHANEKAWR